MNGTTANALRAGASRGWIEYKQSFTTAGDLFGYFGTAAIFLVIGWFLDGETVNGTDVSVGASMIPGVVAFFIAITGVMSVAQVLATEREDGTLLRAKALPRGTFGYLVGKSVHLTLIGVTSVVVLLVPAFLLFDGLRINGAAGVLVLVAGVLLGLLATGPLGAIVGSLVSNPRGSVAALMIPIMGLTAISGVFTPTSLMPVWVQWIAQVFPVYWTGLLMRSAFLPDSMLAAEIGESWRHLEAFSVVGVWAIVGIAVAPAVLRRMARRESGSRVEDARRKAMQRTN
jgi:ABC-2 type transport system permease protein